MKFNGLPLYEFTIDEDDPTDGVTTMSLVDWPAVDKAFIALSRTGHARPVRVCFNDARTLNEQKRVVTGVALRADYPIYRRDDDGTEYYLKLPPAVIEKLVVKFMRESRNHHVNVMHQDNVQGVFLLESFLLTDRHKVAYDEFRDVEPGSWIVSYKVENDSVWQAIREKGLQGFSVEMTGLLAGSHHRYGQTLDDKIDILINELGL